MVFQKNFLGSNQSVIHQDRFLLILYADFVKKHEIQQHHLFLDARKHKNCLTNQSIHTIPLIYTTKLQRNRSTRQVHPQDPRSQRRKKINFRLRWSTFKSSKSSRAGTIRGLLYVRNAGRTQ